MKDILYTYAIDEEGRFISIDKAQKGIKYFCPSCKTEFVLRKSGNKGIGSKRPHFAHKSLSPNCTAESSLHYVFKTLLYYKINSVLNVFEK